jgi:tol-pal system protein YbgF
MKRKLLLGILILSLAMPAAPASKEIVQLQRDVALLQDMVRDLNRLMTERMAVMSQLVERNTDTINKLQGVIENVQRGLAASLTVQAQKIDSGQQHVQAVAESLEDLKARQSRLGEQLVQIRQLLETIQAQPQPALVQTQAAAPPNPKDLYENALRDLQGGKNDLAMAGFADYLKYFGETDLAGNAQFYIGEVHFRKGDYNQAIEAYNLVLDKYPKNNKAATAHWKKAQALLEQRQRDAAVRELNTLIRRFPNSDEAKLARDRLRTLGLRGDAGSPASSRLRKVRR